MRSFCVARSECSVEQYEELYYQLDSLVDLGVIKPFSDYSEAPDSYLGVSMNKLFINDFNMAFAGNVISVETAIELVNNIKIEVLEGDVDKK